MRLLCGLMLAMSLGAEAIAAGGDEALVHEITVRAPIAKVWDAFTVEEEIVTWMVPNAKMDFRIGGTLRTSYNADSTLDADASDTIEHTILAYEPQRLLVMRVTKCPEGFEFAEQVEQTWGIYQFQPIGPEQTHIRISGMGYGEGEVWDAMRAYFTNGNAWTLEQLRKKFEGEMSSAEACAKTMAIAGRMAGGEWVHDGQMPDGSPFLARNVVERGSDGESLTGRAWRGMGSGEMVPHGWTGIYRDPKTETVRFVNVDEHGDVARGVITHDGDDAIVWDWRVVNKDGTPDRYWVKTTMMGDDQYRMELAHIGAESASEPVPLVDIVFDRVDKAPAKFMKVVASER